MKKWTDIRLLIIIIITLLGSVLAGEQSPVDTTAKSPYGWKNGMSAGLNFNQSQFTNWSKGGENTIAWQLLVNGSYDYLRPNYTFDTEFNVNYGRNTVGNQGERKTNDEIRFDLVYNRKIQFPVNPYAAVRFLSQLDDGFEYTDTTATKVSGRFDPAYLTLALGAGYKYKNLLIFNAGPSLKGTFADVFAGIYTDDKETPELETQKWEGGFEFVTKLNWSILQNMQLKSNLVTFTDFKEFETDINWDNTLIAKFTDWLNFNIQFQLIYDQDVSNDLQLRQALAVGLNYTLF